MRFVFYSNITYRLNQESKIVSQMLQRLSVLHVHYTLFVDRQMIEFDISFVYKLLHRLVVETSDLLSRLSYFIFVYLSLPYFNLRYQFTFDIKFYLLLN